MAVTRMSMAPQVLLLLFLSTSAFLPGPSSAAHFVLVHGATQSSWAWFRVVPLLESLGHKVTAVQLLGSGTDCTPPEDLPTIEAIAQPLVEVIENSAEPVVLVGHSLGGVSISTVAEAFPEKVAKLVYVAAYMVPNNKSALDVSSSGNYSSIFSENLVFLPEGGPPVFFALKPEAIVPAVFNRCTKEIQTLGVMLTKPQLIVPLVQPVHTTPERWGSVKRYYVKTDEDNTLRPKLQQDLIHELGVDKAFFIPGSDHEPQLSTPLKLVQIFKQILML